MAIVVALALLLCGCQHEPSNLLSADIYQTTQYCIITNEVVLTSFVYTYAETNELARALRKAE